VNAAKPDEFGPRVTLASVRVRIGVFAVAAALCGRSAGAWGCDGHRAVVFIAERLLPATTLTAARTTLAAAPIDSGLSRFCDPVPGDPLADSATWADDYREADPTTFGWHFIDVPRGATLTTANERRYCPHGNCVVEAIVAQFGVLRASSDPASKGSALRFLLHLIGDVHQPLHAITNGDRGGNCVPVTYYDRAPQQNPNGDFSPNLHAVWDSATIRTLMAQRHVADARGLAALIVARTPLPPTIEARAPTRSTVTAWAEGARQLGSTIGYARLPTPIPIEPPAAARLGSCAENRAVGQRMLAKHEVIDDRYEGASVSAILDQLQRAGIRLAEVLNAAYPQARRAGNASVH
jgi:S1/P1 Nuclease